jgi:hypothetical protein
VIFGRVEDDYQVSALVAEGNVGLGQGLDEVIRRRRKWENN